MPRIPSVEERRDWSHRRPVLSGLIFAALLAVVFAIFVLARSDGNLPLTLEVVLPAFATGWLCWYIAIRRR
jgi:hypothetical protein